MAPKIYRAINEGPDSSVAQARHYLYRRCIAQVNEAIGSEFYVEAVAIIESLLADRLESRLAFKHHQAQKKREFSTAGSLAYQLMGSEGETTEAELLYSKIANWSQQRNKVIHQLVKLGESEQADWDSRYLEAKKTAEKGMDLFRDLDACVTKLNRYKIIP